MCSAAQVAQSVEQRTENPRVDGSIPPLGTIQKQATPQKAQVAQSVEQRTENPRVDGSIPPLGTMNSKGSDFIGAFFISAVLSLLGRYPVLYNSFKFSCYPHLFTSMDYPAEKNNFLVEHVLTIKNSYRQLLLKELIPNILSDEAFAHQLFHAPFAVVSHDTASDPIFNYANLKALELFELNWEEFTRLPSRLSAEPVNQIERG